LQTPPIVQKLSLWCSKLVFASSFPIPSVNPNGSRGKLPIYPSLQDYVVLSFKTLFWASKRRRFGNFIIIFLKKKKRKEKRKRKILKKKRGEGGGKKSGVAPRPVWGWSNHPMAKGVVRPPPKGQNPFFVFFFWGGSRTTPKDLEVDLSTPNRPFGVAESTPKRPKPIFHFFFFLGFWGWPDHPLGHGVVRPPPDRPWGWLQPPRFLSTPFFFLIFSFFLFSFLFFFLKKNNNKMARTTLF
jgi:hypothetical protein